MIVVHHTGKDAAKGSRGWSGLLGALDFELEMTAKKTHGSCTSANSETGSDEQAAFCYRLHGLELGHNQYKEPVTTVVVEHWPTPRHGQGQQVDPHSAGGAQRALGLDQVVQTSHGRCTIAPGMKCTLMGVWKKACIAPGAISKCKDERDRAVKFKNAKEELWSRQKIVCDGKDGDRVYPRAGQLAGDLESARR